MKIKKIFHDHTIKSLIKNSGIVFFGSTSATVLNIISFTMVVNTLGPKLFGLIVLTQTYVLIVNDILNVQTWESLIKFASKDSDEAKLKSYVKTNVTIDLVSAFIAFLVAFSLAKPAANLLQWDEQIILMMSLYSFTILFNLTTFTIGIPRIFDKFTYVAKIHVFAAVLRITFILYGTLSEQTIVFYLIVFIICDMLANLLLIILSFTLLKRRVGTYWWKVKPTIDRQQIKFIWWTNLRTISRIPVRHFDMIIIGLVMSVETVGIYKVYKEIAGIMERIGEPVNQVIFPEFAKLIGGGNTKESLNVAKQTIVLLSILSAVMSGGLILSGKFIVVTFFGEEFLPQINALYFLILIFGASLVTVPINSLFIAAGFAKSGFYIVVFTNLTYLLAAFFLGKSIGIYGIISAMAIQMVLNQGFKIIILKRNKLGWNAVIR